MIEPAKRRRVEKIGTRPFHVPEPRSVAPNSVQSSTPDNLQSDAPTPEEAAASTVPADDGLRLGNDEDAGQPQPVEAQASPEQPIEGFGAVSLSVGKKARTAARSESANASVAKCPFAPGKSQISIRRQGLLTPPATGHWPRSAVMTSPESSQSSGAPSS